MEPYTRLPRLSASPPKHRVSQYRKRMALPSWVVWFRGRPTCPCLERWLPIFERELIALGVIRHNIDIAQLTGDAEASAGVHAGGGAFDLWQHDDTTVWLARQMGAPATWARTTGSFANAKHVHGVLMGCPHNGPARYQIDEVFDGGDGLVGSAPDPGPRPIPRRTWREGIKWANAQKRQRDEKENDVPAYKDWTDAEKAALANDVATEVLTRKVKVIGAGGKAKEITVKQALARIANGVTIVRGDVEDMSQDVGLIQTTLDEMNS
jgi:hypothetical protein